MSDVLTFEVVDHFLTRMYAEKDQLKEQLKHFPIDLKIFFSFVITITANYPAHIRCGF